MRRFTLLLVLLASCHSTHKTDPKPVREQTAERSVSNPQGRGIFQFESLVVGPLKTNCYFVWDGISKKGVIIDPGDEADKIATEVKRLGIEVVGLVATHGHFDHVSAVPSLKKTLQVPFHMHREDEPQLPRIPAMAKMMGVAIPEVPALDKALTDGQILRVGGLRGSIIHTPGHSRGGVSIRFGDTLFSGDTLFEKAIGRTDLYGGSSKTLLASIRQRILTLKDNVTVLPGHGAATTIGDERANNPFLKQKHF